MESIPIAHTADHCMPILDQCGQEALGDVSGGTGQEDPHLLSFNGRAGVMGSCQDRTLGMVTEYLGQT